MSGQFPLDPNAYYMPAPPYPFDHGPRFGPYFDGAHSRNLTTNPYLNTLFSITDTMQDMTFQNAAMEASLAGNQGLAYANAVINPALHQANQLYNMPLPPASTSQETAGAPVEEVAPPESADEGGGVGSALGHAAGGAAVGAMVGGLPGAVVGGVVGGIVGFFG